MSEWTLRGGHLAERMQLVLIIALGESIIITGTGFSELPGGASTTVAFIVAFLGSVALWWVYFGRHAEEGAHRVEEARDDATRVARTAYAYAHAIMVLGVIVSAVADIAATLVLAGLVAADARARFSPAGASSPGSRV